MGISPELIDGRIPGSVNGCKLKTESLPYVNNRIFCVRQIYQVHCTQSSIQFLSKNNF